MSGADPAQHVGVPGRRQLVGQPGRPVRSRPEQVHDPHAAVRGQPVQLGSEGDLSPAAGPVDQGGFAGPVGQVAEQRQQWGDPDPAGQHQHRPAAVGLPGQLPVRPLDQHPGARPQPRDPGAAITEILDGDPQQIPAGRRGQRVGVRTGPAGPIQEPPLKELPGSHRQPVQPAAAQIHRGQARTLGHHVADRQPVPPAAPQWHPDPVDQKGAGGRRVQRPPVGRT